MVGHMHKKQPIVGHPFMATKIKNRFIKNEITLISRAQQSHVTGG